MSCSDRAPAEQSEQRLCQCPIGAAALDRPPGKHDGVLRGRASDLVE